MTPIAKGAQRDGRMLLLIGAFKLAKAVSLVGLGLAALLLARGDPQRRLIEWLGELHVDPGNRYLGALLERVGLLDGRRLTTLGAGTLLYGGLFAAEGIGLLLRRRWGEYLTILITGS